jgi:drug/metabolite transporter (DMT)-like permease
VSRSRSIKAHLLLLGITVIWGCGFVLVKQALAQASPLALSAARMSLAAILLAAHYRKHVIGIARDSFLSGALAGLFLYLGFAFQTSGLKLTTPSKSAFLTGISAVLVPPLMVLFLRTRIHPWRAVGVILALFGLFFMSVPAGGQVLADFTKVNRGDILSLACAIAFALYIILVGRATQRHPFEQIAVVQMAVAAALMIATAPLMERPHLPASETVVTTVLFTGAVSTAVAFTVQAWAQQFTPATHAALIFTLEPVFAWLTSFLYLRERLGWRAGAGALLILGGVLVSELLGQVTQPDNRPAAQNPAQSGCAG